MDTSEIKQYFCFNYTDFKKLHEAQFKKMQSIDDYVQRRTKMIKNLSNSINKVNVSTGTFPETIKYPSVFKRTVSF